MKVTVLVGVVLALYFVWLLDIENLALLTIKLSVLYNLRSGLEVTSITTTGLITLTNELNRVVN